MGRGRATCPRCNGPLEPELGAEAASVTCEGCGFCHEVKYVEIFDDYLADWSPSGWWRDLLGKLAPSPEVLAAALKTMPPYPEEALADMDDDDDA
jgi:hypothetical protein